MAREKRAESEPWLRCLGLRARWGRRDDAVWKQEIDRRIDVLVEKKTTPLEKKDFDFRVRRFLHEFSLHSNVIRVSEALAYIESSTARKNRDDVRSWPAYLATLLNHFEPKLYEVLVDRDRRLRAEGRQKRAGQAAAVEPYDRRDLHESQESCESHERFDRRIADISGEVLSGLSQGDESGKTQSFSSRSSSGSGRCSPSSRSPTSSTTYRHDSESFHKSGRLPSVLPLSALSHQPPGLNGPSGSDMFDRDGRSQQSIPTSAEGHAPHRTFQ